ncbi:MAG: hypothetical protein KUG74_07165 [Rhodobacteraceae bacterium]|nr:hypothetical protein [Paracoccaceae bacterium]
MTIYTLLKTEWAVRFLAAIIGFVLIAGNAHAAGWSCTAEKLKDYRYNGGKYAMIHISPYQSGGRYKVVKVSATDVTGKTKDGTSFACTKS